MIIAYTGPPGGGKTTALAHRALEAMKQGRLVFSNVNIKGTYKITLQDLIDFRIPEGSVILIDEGGRWFNSQDWKNLPSEIYDLFTMHRHLQMDMYIAVISFARINKSLREVIELTYWARNNKMLPFHKYEGFYELEKVGSMRRDYDVSHLVWKTRKVRSMFNTYAMKNEFAHKDEIPLIEWKDFKVANKKFFERLKQKIRVQMKIAARNKRRSRSISPEENERQYIMKMDYQKGIRVIKNDVQLRKEISKRGILYKTSDDWISVQTIMRVQNDKRRQAFIDRWKLTNLEGSQSSQIPSNESQDTEKKTS